MIRKELVMSHTHIIIREELMTSHTPYLAASLKTMLECTDQSAGGGVFSLGAECDWFLVCLEGKAARKVTVTDYFTAFC
ncbi:hypothetical protein XELAEV_18045162mg [Xenopus laevis]|uniref:Uncharacterized protein n=1 Tax=Xenopus laevis TaxID=8355 RepID=A0A974C075_XENLA|nr:hypothetical protein XELAEV_18045162mg [Xenopus laevis]